MIYESYKNGDVIFNKRKPRILLVGPGRMGKDSVAEIFSKYGYKFQSSSRAAAEIFIYEELKHKFGYKDIEECYEDRNSTDEKRALWYDMICDYNKDDRSRLAKEIMKNNDVYVGMRDKAEIDQCIREGVFDLIIWVDASTRLEYREPATSMNIDKSVADFIIDNNGTVEDLERKVGSIIRNFR